MREDVQGDQGVGMWGRVIWACRCVDVLLLGFRLRNVDERGAKVIVSV